MRRDPVPWGFFDLSSCISFLWHLHYMKHNNRSTNTSGFKVKGMVYPKL